MQRKEKLIENQQEVELYKLGQIYGVVDVECILMKLILANPRIPIMDLKIYATNIVVLNALNKNKERP